MKKILLALSALFAVNAHADVCSEFMPCGTYEGTGAWYDVSNNKIRDYNEQIVITAVTPTMVNLKVYIYGATKGEPWTDAILEFKPDGQYNVIHNEDRQVFGTGFCADQVCTVSFRPVNIKDRQPPFVNSFVNILRFEGTTLKRYNMVSNNTKDEDIKFQRSTLTKK